MNFEIEFFEIVCVYLNCGGEFFVECMMIMLVSEWLFFEVKGIVELFVCWVDLMVVLEYGLSDILLFNCDDFCVVYCFG